jgi:hypothetical protein
MSEFGSNCVLPWLCIGDFNAITSQTNKLGGRSFNRFYFNNFAQFMNQFGMIDLGFSSNSFTWSNHCQCSSLIKERLDRGIASIQWVQQFPSYSISHLPAHTSDQNPLLLDTSVRYPSLLRPFRFEEFWTRDLSCGVVVKES